MATFSHPFDLYKAQAARFQGTIMTAQEMHADLVKASHRDAKQLTMGGVGRQGPGRKRWLREAGHPYGRGFVKNGRERRRVKDLPIGSISGRLHNAPQIFVRRNLTSGRFDSGSESRLEFRNVPYAKYVIPRTPRANSKMRHRGFWEEMDKRAKARNRALVEAVRARQRRAA